MPLEERWIWDSPWNEKNDAIGEAKEEGYSEVVSLLERFKVNPTLTKNEVRKELLWFGEESEIFAPVVFLCDGPLEIRKKNLTGS